MLHTLAGNVRALLLSAQVPLQLLAVQQAASHAACEEALVTLQAHCSTWEGAAALAAADWQVRYTARSARARFPPRVCVCLGSTLLEQ